jgi:hypothetical protein
VAVVEFELLESSFKSGVIIFFLFLSLWLMNFLIRLRYETKNMKDSFTFSMCKVIVKRDLLRFKSSHEFTTLLYSLIEYLNVNYLFRISKLNQRQNLKFATKK